eukprot:CAMPEP_0116898802 /NCGR_PEP_ID=MMETSP0467-20121206/7470_1 /TAXON_ID=283647 /ORGANISM="Mesodinium pulex, Strain SPMC105" /LENGTH=157 /DNA_ID=CAMNT_0004571185 /DNA_START=1252 /DNA_END=1724 /DNA_ORIENTATION=+
MQSIDINSDNITKELNNFINHTNGVIGGKSGKEKEEHDAKDRIDNRNASVDRDRDRERHNIYRNTGGQKYKESKESKDKENPTNTKTPESQLEERAGGGRGRTQPEQVHESSQVQGTIGQRTAVSPQSSKQSQHASRLDQPQKQFCHERVEHIPEQY